MDAGPIHQGSTPVQRQTGCSGFFFFSFFYPKAEKKEEESLLPKKKQKPKKKQIPKHNHPILSKYQNDKSRKTVNTTERGNGENIEHSQAEDVNVSDVSCGSWDITNDTVFY